MTDLSAFSAYSTCDYSDCLPENTCMDRGIRPMWSGGPRLVGIAYTVKCEPGDNLMVHAAIYKAPPGSVLVVDAGDQDLAVVGGNVCATAAQRGIAGFVIDGVIRDIAEVRALAFPVYARGNVPRPGIKAKLGQLETPVTCGGITVCTGDIVIADEEGIVIIPADTADAILAMTQQSYLMEQAQTRAQWQNDHYQKVTELLSTLEQAAKAELP